MGFLVFYIETMPVEACVAAFACHLDAETKAVGMTIEQAKSELVFSKLEHRYQAMLFLGNYWDEQLSKVNPNHYCRINIYSFGNKSSVQLHEDIVYYNMPYNGPVSFFEAVWTEFHTLSIPRATTVNWKIFRDVLELLEDRILERNLLKTQTFFAGLHSHPAIKGSSAFERFSSFLKLDATYSEVNACGEQLLNGQLKMAADRVRNNSAFITLSNGRTAAVTDAPDLVNLTHDALHSAHPSAELTMIASLKFSEDATTVAVSYRATPNLKGDFHLGDEMTKHHGGGSKTAAGTRVDIKFDPPC